LLVTSMLLALPAAYLHGSSSAQHCRWISRQLSLHANGFRENLPQQSPIPTTNSSKAAKQQRQQQQQQEHHPCNKKMKNLMLMAQTQQCRPSQ